MNQLSSGTSIQSYNFVSDWIIFDNNMIQVLTGKIDIGQHISTTLALIASRELDINIKKIEVVNVKTNLSPNEGFTAGSLSVSQSGTALKSATITFRNSFIEYICSKYNVKLEDINLENGIAKILGTNIYFSYWDFAKLDNFKNIIILPLIPIRLIEPNLSNSRNENKLINNIVTGKYRFIHDLDFPNMLHARMVRPPNYFSKVKSLDQKLISKIESLNINIIVKGSFIAVVGGDEYEVIKSAKRIAISCTWDLLEDLEVKDINEMLLKNDKDTLLVKRGGEAFHEEIPKNKFYNEKEFITLNSTYSKPYIMHGSIGPSAACSIYQDNKFKIFTHSQGIYQTRSAISEALKVDENNIEINFMPGAGCYGHNGADDAAYEAAVISETLPGKYILLKWTREEEHCWEPYGSAALSVVKGSLDLKGNIVYWAHETFADTFLSRPTKGSADNLLSFKYLNNNFNKKRNKPNTAPHMGIHRNLDPLYNFKNTRLVKNLVHNLPLRTSALRGLGAFGNVFAIESFLNELAEVAKIDPITFRLNHLEDIRAKEVLLDLQKQLSNTPLGINNTRGIAFARYKNSAAYCAVGVEINVTDDVEIKLINSWISIDAGEVVYEEGVTSQIEGGFIQAASWTLYEDVQYDTKSILSTDWDNYKIIGFDNIPKININIIDKKGFPFLGVGEVVAGPVSAAIANALYECLGVRTRHLPLTKDKIKNELLK